VVLAALLTAAALRASSTVPVTGGTNAERVIVREALGALDRGAVSSAQIDPNHYLVLGPSSLRDPSAAYGRAEWEAQALVATVAARFAAAGDRLVGYRIMGNCGHNTSCGSGGTLSAADSPATGPRGARRLRAVVLASARATGLAVRVAQVLPIGGGVLSVVVRLREDQLLDAKLPAALAALFGPVTQTPGPLHFVSIEAPDGTSVAYGGTFVNGGSWNYGGDTGTAPVPRAVPPLLAQARTALAVHITHGFGALAIDRTFRFVCGSGTPRQGNCSRLLADRWSLLVPTTTSQCAGPIGGWDVEVTGTFAGHAVSRAYNGCYGATGLRWARFLGIAG